MQKKGQATRSPQYPAFSLPDAIEKVRLLYEADYRAGAPAEAAVKHLGYKGRSGPANTALAALKRFGLVESHDGRIVPTQRAIEIIELPNEDPRKKEAIQEAALNPPVYRHHFEMFQGRGGVPSQESFETELKVEGKFNPKVVKNFVKDFRETLLFAGLMDENGMFSVPGVRNEEESDNEESSKIQAKQGVDSNENWGRQQKAGMKQDVYSLEEGDIVLQWPSNLSEASLEEIEDWFKLMLRKLKRSVLHQKTVNKHSGEDNE